MTQEWREKWQNCVSAFGNIVLGEPLVWFGNVCFYECGAKILRLTIFICFVVVVQLLSPVWLSATPRSAAHQAPCPSLSRSLLGFLSIESVVPSSHLTLCRLLLPLPSVFPSIRCFTVSCLFSSGGQSIGASASASVLPMNIQGWSPLGLTTLSSLQSKGPSRVFSSTTIWKHQFLGAQPFIQSNSHIYTWKNCGFDCTVLCQQSDIFTFQYAFMVYNF